MVVLRDARGMPLSHIFDILCVACFFPFSIFRMEIMLGYWLHHVPGRDIWQPRHQVFARPVLAAHVRHGPTGVTGAEDRPKFWRSVLNAGVSRKYAKKPCS